MWHENLNLIMGIVVVYGFNLTFWGTVGIIRALAGVIRGRWVKEVSIIPLPQGGKPGGISISEVASITPAHNEEAVIAQTIEPLLEILPKEQIFVISDGSKDKTAEIAKSYGVNVVEFLAGHGKAGALEKGITHFQLTKRFRAILFVDADTWIPKNFLERALPHFDNFKIAAVAGYARTAWEPKKNNFWNMFFIAHRERVYTIIQLFFKFGQTSRWLNVASIIPGFASIYRTDVLEKIDVNPPGLVIEDYNMTFEVHHKKLGLIAHHPSISAYTQDPNTFKDYFRQVKRWNLGFWQTIRRHGIWASVFWVALLVYIAEVFVSSIIFILLPLVILLHVLVAVFPEVLSVHFVSSIATYTRLQLPWEVIFWAILIPDYSLSLFTAFVQGRPHYLWYGLGFPFMRFFDALSFVYTLPKGLFTISSGRWISPKRR
ncbi:hypothetical protein A2841_01195 [Candidatus Kaiserbacteria bacterium RIFCSPHIGHO2_01_FULL_48_10]|uniref:Glycosyltransferase 2-like domain-containing protein n=1 Tax=Candidatus Kaiserbacteria bacterium RIFCSPHIGHO2_01_FULL_48_10 TaxID=1798476 RepID=A0A1F6C4K4_9BACT|nr:MAG: hypothetical protein A2841_01195 [Candidatus Kaiserbacteria bacterium RIFCSPHIGHO2_01_FULL_48_10]